jgi:hypothetical protein
VNIGFTAAGLMRPAFWHCLIQTSPSAAVARSWLVMAITTRSSLTQLQAALLTTRAGRRLEVV